MDSITINAKQGDVEIYPNWDKDRIIIECAGSKITLPLDDAEITARVIQIMIQQIKGR